MDLNYLQKKILFEEARIKGFTNWESMKLAIPESEGKLIEGIVLRSLKEAKESIGQQGQQVLSRY